MMGEALEWQVMTEETIVGLRPGDKREAVITFNSEAARDRWLRIAVAYVKKEEK